MKIAIVGAGVSGLVAAHLLHPEHDVTVLEAAPYAGGHTNTITIPGGARDGADLPVDTGFIVFNERNYPHFEALLAELGVASQPSDMSFGVSADDGRFSYATTSANGLFDQRRNLLRPSFHRMLLDVGRFHRAARALLASDDDPSLAVWLREQGFSRGFVERLIVPQTAAVWSADPGTMDAFSARFLAEFFDNHGMLSLRGRPRWRTVVGGSHTYVRALVAPLGDRVRLSTPVHRIDRDEDGVTILAGEDEAERFDHVILAAHADRSLALLTAPTALEREIVGAFAYQPNEVTLHTDTSLMPARRRAWASWNYHLPDGPAALPTVTYHMNRLQNLDAERDYLVTLNRTEAIDPDTIVRTIAYEHPVFTPGAVAAQERWGEVAGRHRTHYCGAYWGWGFHEDGVVSGIRAARDVQAVSLLEGAAA